MSSSPAACSRWRWACSSKGATAASKPFLDLVKLSTKEVIIPTSAVRGAFLAAPVVALGGIAMCAALLPVPGVTDGLPKMGDLLVIFYLFPIPAMAICAAAMLAIAMGTK